MVSWSLTTPTTRPTNSCLVTKKGDTFPVPSQGRPKTEQRNVPSDAVTRGAETNEVVTSTTIGGIRTIARK